MEKMRSSEFEVASHGVYPRGFLSKSKLHGASKLTSLGHDLSFVLNWRFDHKLPVRPDTAGINPAARWGEVSKGKSLHDSILFLDKMSID
jgi:hypothetical protein